MFEMGGRAVVVEALPAIKVAAEVPELDTDGNGLALAAGPGTLPDWPLAETVPAPPPPQADSVSAATMSPQELKTRPPTGI
jgi:hypothetical protein